MKGTAFASIRSKLEVYSEYGSLNARIFTQTYPLKEDVQTLQDQKISDFLQNIENLLKKEPQTEEKQILRNLITACKLYLKEKTTNTKEGLKRNSIVLFDFIIKKTEELRLQIREKLIEKGGNTSAGIFLYNALAVINEAHGFFREIIERDYSIDSELLSKLIDRYLNVWKSISAIKEKSIEKCLDVIADSQMGLNKAIRNTRVAVGVKPIISPNWQSEVMANAVLGHS